MSREKLIEEIDFYFNEEGLMVLTEAYLSKRGFCCENICKHCPYRDWEKEAKENN